MFQSPQGRCHFFLSFGGAKKGLKGGENWLSEKGWLGQVWGKNSIAQLAVFLGGWSLLQFGFLAAGSIPSEAQLQPIDPHAGRVSQYPFFQPIFQWVTHRAITTVN